MPRFAEKFGIARGAMITAVDLLAGIAALIGWERVDSPGITSYHDTDYAMQGRVTCEAIERFDIVCSHVESPDEASHQGDWRTKVASIEAIDQHVVGPVAEHLRRQHGSAWRLLIMPDHYTLVSTRKHDATPPPWLIVGSDVRSEKPDVPVRFTEEWAQAGGIVVRPGDEIMNLFLRGRLS
jgi:2,3-bisphosphoglycerate-independent phosphoglycerate mutase